eukprot:scaffold63074_cov39-Phaeocystis_antarctica.AAC.2
MPPLTVSHGGWPENAELKQRSASQPMSRVTARRQPEIEPAVNEQSARGRDLPRASARSSRAHRTLPVSAPRSRGA